MQDIIRTMIGANKVIGGGGGGWYLTLFERWQPALGGEKFSLTVLECECLKLIWLHSREEDPLPSPARLLRGCWGRCWPPPLTEVGMQSTIKKWR